MKKILCIVVTITLMICIISAEANSIVGNITSEPIEPETDSIFEMLDAVNNGAMAAALINDEIGQRYVFIVGANEKCLYVFDPEYPGITKVELWQAEEWNFDKFYVYYSDSPFDELAMN